MMQPMTLIDPMELAQEFLGGGGRGRRRHQRAMPGYPPINLYQDSEQKRVIIEMALAGFRSDELEVLRNRHMLVIRSVREDAAESAGHTPEADGYQCLHRGIAKRNFSVQLPLEESMRVQKTRFDQGILRIEVEREEEAYQRLEIQEPAEAEA